MKTSAIAGFARAVAERLPTPELRAHTAPCAKCPSAHYPPDPEALDILAWPPAERVQTAFPCGWNGKRFCKGYCDQMGISDQDLAAAGEQLLGRHSA
jgi:hypothetical protein